MPRGDHLCLTFHYATRATRRQGEGISTLRARTNVMIVDPAALEATDVNGGMTDTPETVNEQAPQMASTTHMETPEDIWIVTANTSVPPPPQWGCNV